jgi:hypothetical protein
MNTEEFVATLKQQLPDALRENPDLREYILNLTRQHYAGRHYTDDRFDRVLNELARDREEQRRKWDESTRRWELEFDKVHEEIMAVSRKQDRQLGALGARWGTQSEKAFRAALAGVLTESFGVTVQNVTEFDETGDVFGRPDQVELDIVIKNGTLLLLELKSSIDKAGMYVFERKARFYEKKHKRKANRLIVISPMVDARAKPVAEKLGIEIYGDSYDVEAL